MSAIFFLILRFLLIIALYGFLVWAIYTMWRDLRAAGTSVQAQKAPTISLTITNTLDSQVRTFNSPEIMIGRSVAATFTIRNETVSSNHARLSYRQNQWWVEDLHSTNGTFLNEERIYMPTVVMSSDDLRCGQVNIQIQIEE
jgi:pSer/pThr/pTyr-binding forkhead associated (FHA) protein